MKGKFPSCAKYLCSFFYISVSKKSVVGVQRDFSLKEVSTYLNDVTHEGEGAEFITFVKQCIKRMSWVKVNRAPC